MGLREQEIERGRLQLNLASLSIHGSVKYPVKSHQPLAMTVLQRGIEGKSYLFSQCPPVHYAVRFSRNSSI